MIVVSLSINWLMQQHLCVYDKSLYVVLCVASLEYAKR
jgi:hypothetical protein